MLSLGASAPKFENLLSTDGRRYSLDSFDERPVLVIVFTCNHCPYSKAYENRMIEMQRDYASRGAQLVAINSNDDSAYPQDSYPEMVKRAKEKRFNFVYLRDADQTAVDAYGAVCTPHVFLFDAKRILRYRGRIDDSRDASKVRSPDLRNAIEEVIRGVPVTNPDTRPFGCSIKFSQG
ncbi:MAG: thioredoxin family protein [Nitrososphaerales archaeon]